MADLEEVETGMAASMRVTPLIGTIVDQNPLLGAVNPAFSIPGKFKTGSQYLGLTWIC